MLVRSGFHINARFDSAHRDGGYAQYRCWIPVCTGMTMPGAICYLVQSAFRVAVLCGPL